MTGLPLHLQQLDTALLDLPEDWDAMLLSDLDGFLAGIAVCPDRVPVDEWWPVLWRGEEAGDPVPPETVEAATAPLREGILRHYHDTTAALARDLYEPIFDIDKDDDVLWEPWAYGFGRAMQLRPDAWQRIADAGGKDDSAAAIGAMRVLVDWAIVPPEEPEDDEVAALIDDAANVIPDLVAILAEWHIANVGPLHEGAGSARSAKVGRNDACPCGSGKKYKKCCGAAA